MRGWAHGSRLLAPFAELYQLWQHRSVTTLNPAKKTVLCRCVSGVSHEVVQVGIKSAGFWFLVPYLYYLVSYVPNLNKKICSLKTMVSVTHLFLW